MEIKMDMQITKISKRHLQVLACLDQKFLNYLISLIQNTKVKLTNHNGTHFIQHLSFLSKNLMKTMMDYLMLMNLKNP